jgi:hypothetical protein
VAGALQDASGACVLLGRTALVFLPFTRQPLQEFAADNITCHCLLKEDADGVVLCEP